MSAVTNDMAEFKVSLDMQQFNPEDVKVKTVDNFIVIEGTHEDKKDEAGGGVIERSFVRKYLMPEGVKADEISCELSRDGVLTIHAPKVPLVAAPSREKEIPIKHPAGGEEQKLERQPLKEVQRPAQPPQEQGQPPQLPERKKEVGGTFEAVLPPGTVERMTAEAKKPGMEPRGPLMTENPPGAGFSKERGAPHAPERHEARHEVHHVPLAEHHMPQRHVAFVGHDVPPPEHHIPAPEHHVPLHEHLAPMARHHVPMPEHAPRPEHHVSTPERHEVSMPEHVPMREEQRLPPAVRNLPIKVQVHVPAAEHHVPSMERHAPRLEHHVPSTEFREAAQYVTEQKPVVEHHVAKAEQHLEMAEKHLEKAEEHLPPVPTLGEQGQAPAPPPLPSVEPHPSRVLHVPRMEHHLAQAEIHVPRPEIHLRHVEPTERHGYQAPPEIPQPGEPSGELREKMAKLGIGPGAEHHRRTEKPEFLSKHEHPAPSSTQPSEELKEKMTSIGSHPEIHGSEEVQHARTGSDRLVPPESGSGRGVEHILPVGKGEAEKTTQTEEGLSVQEKLAPIGTESFQPVEHGKDVLPTMPMGRQHLKHQEDVEEFERQREEGLGPDEGIIREMGQPSEVEEVKKPEVPLGQKLLGPQKPIQSTGVKPGTMPLGQSGLHEVPAEEGEFTRVPPGGLGQAKEHPVPVHIQQQPEELRREKQEPMDIGEAAKPSMEQHEAEMTPPREIPTSGGIGHQEIQQAPQQLEQPSVPGFDIRQHRPPMSGLTVTAAAPTPVVQQKLEPSAPGEESRPSAPRPMEPTVIVKMQPSGMSATLVPPGGLGGPTAPGAATAMTSPAAGQPELQPQQQQQGVEQPTRTEVGGERGI